MRRVFLVDADVQAAIWRDQRKNERSINDILRRKLRLTPEIGGSQRPAVVHVERTGTTFVEGFEIFRIYKGREYRAQAVDGGWMLLQTGEVYPSLNKLSRGIGTGVENAWNFWCFWDSEGERQHVAKLRSASAREGT